MNKRNIAALTGLRAVAAALVFFYHWFFQHVEVLPLLIRAPFKVGYVGVPIFFALSGFLITIRYREAFATGAVSYGRYMWKRVLRFFPLYLFVVIAFVWAFGRPENMIPQSTAAWISTLTLTQSLFPDWIFLGTTVGWTLTIEMIFYALAPLMLRPVSDEQSFLSIAGYFVLLSVVAIGLGIVVSGISAETPTLLGQDVPWLMHYTIFGHLPDFIVGMFAGILYQRQRELPRLSTQIRPIITVSLLGMYGAMILLDLLGRPYGTFVDRSLAFLVSLFAAMLILGMSLDQSRTSATTRLLASRAAVYLGVISYALYLIQLTEPIQWLHWLAIGKYGGVENQIVRAILIYIISTPIAMLLYEWVEKPLHKLLSRQ